MRRAAALALVAGGTLAVGTLAWLRLKRTPKAEQLRQVASGL